MPLEYSEYRPPGGKCVIVKPTMKRPRNSQALAIAVVLALAVGVLCLSELLLADCNCSNRSLSVYACV